MLNEKKNEIEKSEVSNLPICNERRGKTVYKRKYLDVELKKYKKLDFE
ncbi:hypothetical protein GCM10008931_31340 [Oceanobacillus oncorhynchi subsp. oncorhynchi]